MSDTPSHKDLSLDIPDELAYFPDSPRNRLIAVTPRELTLTQLKARDGLFEPGPVGFQWYTGTTIGGKFKCGPAVLDNIPKSCTLAAFEGYHGLYPETNFHLADAEGRRSRLASLVLENAPQKVHAPIGEKPVRGGVRGSKSKRKQQATSRKHNRRN